MRGRAEAARRAHNPEVGGSNPPPATNDKDGLGHPFFVSIVSLEARIEDTLSYPAPSVGS